MKAIKYLSVLFFLGAVLFSCKPQDQQKHSLDPVTKAYLEIKNGSKYTFTQPGDTNVVYVYNTTNYNNSQSNPDIENSEILSYDLVSPGQPKITIRAESGGTQFRDRIAVVTNRNDTNFVGPIIFNLDGTFSTITNSGDTVFSYLTYTINGKVFNDVVRVKLYNTEIYREIFFAKNIGLIARREKNGTLYYAKSYSIVK
ncbi:MAG: hypothetical protein PSX81_04930 [bacterium]|nr:hypothetical protein [bacterium]